MTLEELEALRLKVIEVTGAATWMCLDVNGWNVFHGGMCRFKDVSHTEMVGHLKVLATPPKPAMVTITVRTDIAETIAFRRRQAWREWDGPLCNIADACAEAIAPYQPPKTN